MILGSLTNVFMTNFSTILTKVAKRGSAALVGTGVTLSLLGILPLTANAQWFDGGWGGYPYESAALAFPWADAQFATFDGGGCGGSCGGCGNVCYTEEAYIEWFIPNVVVPPTPAPPPPAVNVVQTVTQIVKVNEEKPAPKKVAKKPAPKPLPKKVTVSAPRPVPTTVKTGMGSTLVLSIGGLLTGAGALFLRRLA
jgi:hypothetical protein